MYIYIVGDRFFGVRGGAMEVVNNYVNRSFF